FRLAIETVLGNEGLSRALTALPALLERNTDTRLLTKGVSTPANTSSARRRSSAASWAGTSSAVKRKRRRAAGAWIAVASVLVVGGGAAGFFYWPQLRTLGFSPSSAPASVQQADVGGGAGLGLDSALSGGIAVPADSLRLVVADSTATPIDTTATPGDASAVVASTESSGPRAPMVWTSPATSQPTAPAIDAPPATQPSEEAKPEKKVQEEPAKVFREGYLSITVDPSCEVWVNGKYRGDASPTLRLTLPTGRQTIECRHPKSETYMETIQIVSGELSRRNITLKRLRGIISLATTEGAELYIDGQLIGITPIMRPIEVEAGTHTVTIKKSNFYAWTSEVVVEANEMLPLKITLSPRY
ncbi:MAG TPA: PEGA domain-containing protein, partial [Candidatus Krumholzibacteria bacterium]|nr:PEGA domain-containing protein [Candidatus Krumholzibacteria bacterium]